MANRALPRYFLTWGAGLATFVILLATILRLQNDPSSSWYEEEGIEWPVTIGFAIVPAVVVYAILNFAFILRSRQVVISYAHADRKYARKLRRFIRSQGIRAWMDTSLRYGDDWPAKIRRRIDNCSALIVIMTPASKGSKWVEKETRRAEKNGKPVFPILLTGKPHKEIRKRHQYYEVIRGGTPGEKWITALKRHTG